MKFSCFQITITSNASWIRRTLGKAKLMELLMPCLDAPSGVLRKKRPCEPRIRRSYTNCNFCWHGSRGWAFRVWFLICGTAVLPQLRQFWDTIRSELADEGPYTVSIGGMKMRLPELQDDDKEAKKLRSEGLSEG